MSDISKIKPLGPTGPEYDLKDAVSRYDYVEFSASTSEAARAALETLSIGNHLVKFTNSISIVKIQSHNGTGSNQPSGGLRAGTIFRILKVSSTEFYAEVVDIPETSGGVTASNVFYRGITFLRSTNAGCIFRYSYSPGSDYGGYIPYQYINQLVTRNSDYGYFDDQETLNSLLQSPQQSLIICGTDTDVGVETAEGTTGYIPAYSTGLGLAGGTEDDGPRFVIFFAPNGSLWKYWDSNPNADQPEDHQYHFDTLVSV